MVHSSMYTVIGVNLQLDVAENLIFYKKIVYIVVTFERKEQRNIQRSFLALFL